MKSSLHEPESVSPASVLQIQITDTFFDIRDIGMQHVLDVLVCKPVFVGRQVSDSPPYLMYELDRLFRIFFVALYARHRTVLYCMNNIMCIVKDRGYAVYKTCFRKIHLFHQEFPVPRIADSFSSISRRRVYGKLSVIGDSHLPDRHGTDEIVTYKFEIQSFQFARIAEHGILYGICPDVYELRSEFLQDLHECREISIEYRFAIRICEVFRFRKKMLDIIVECHSVPEVCAFLPGYDAASYPRHEACELPVGGTAFTFGIRVYLYDIAV